MEGVGEGVRIGMGEDVREEPEADASSSSTRIDSRRPFKVVGRGLLGLFRVRVAGERRKDVGSTEIKRQLICFIRRSAAGCAYKLRGRAWRS